MKQEYEGTLLFEEVQRWRSTWIGLFLLIAGVSMVGMTLRVYALLASGARPDESLPVALLLVTVVTGLAGLWLVALTLLGGLIVQVRPDALYVQHLLLTRRHRYPYETIASCEARTYRPLGEFGGWGVRFGWGSSGKAYNVSGDQGVQLVFTDGRRLLLGSRQPEALARAINDARGRGSTAT